MTIVFRWGRWYSRGANSTNLSSAVHLWECTLRPTWSYSISCWISGRWDSQKVYWAEQNSLVIMNFVSRSWETSLTECSRIGSAYKSSVSWRLWRHTERNADDGQCCGSVSRTKRWHMMFGWKAQWNVVNYEPPCSNGVLHHTGLGGLRAGAENLGYHKTVELLTTDIWSFTDRGLGRSSEVLVARSNIHLARCFNDTQHRAGLWYSLHGSGATRLRHVRNIKVVLSIFSKIHHRQYYSVSSRVKVVNTAPYSPLLPYGTLLFINAWISGRLATCLLGWLWSREDTEQDTKSGKSRHSFWFVEAQ